MKSKLLPLFLFLCFILFGSTVASAGVSFWGSIWAGQTIHAGDFHVYTSGSNLYIVISPLYDWKLAEVHVHANADLPPMNGSGRPKVGHFMWGDDSIEPPSADPYVLMIPFSTTGATATQSIYVAIHVVVVKTDGMGYVIQNETGWGGPCSSVWDPAQNLPAGFFPWGRGWGYYFMYTL